MNLQLFALEPAHELGRKVSAKLGIPVSPHEEREFEDGEHKCRPLASVRAQVPAKSAIPFHTPQSTEYSWSLVV